MTIDDAIERAKERVIESVAQNMDLYGITPSVGRLYGILYFEGKAMSLDELKEELAMSKTSMSTGVRSLMELNMVEKVWKKGERKDFYKYKEDWYQNFIDLFCIRWKKGIDMNLQSSRQSLKELERIIANGVSEEEKAKAEMYIEKIRYAIDYYEWLNEVIDLFETKEIFSIVEKKGNKKTNRT